MKLHHLRDFTTVAATGSLRAAARQLGLSQPALTKNLQQFERELGYALFERSARGATLSAAGHRFLPRAQAVLNELERGVGELRELDGQGGRVNVALSSAVAIPCLAGALHDFRQRYPQAPVRIVAGHYPVMFPELRSGALDFFVGPRPGQALSDEFVLEEVFRNTRSVVGRKGHPLGRATSLGELVDATWVVTGATGAAATENDQLFLRHGLPVPAARVVCEYDVGLLVLLASTDMLSILPRQWAHTTAFGGALAEIRVRESLPGPDIVLVRRAGLPLTPAAQHMLTLIQRHVAYHVGAAAPAAGDADAVDAPAAAPRRRARR